MKTALALIVALMLAPTALVACGGDDGDTVTAGVLEEEPADYPGDIGQWVIEIEADPDGDLAYTFDEVVSPPGNTNFVFENPQTVAHDVAVETIGGEQQGKTDVVKEDMGWLRLYLPPETKYTFYCSVPGHREAGMEGTVTIDEAVEPEGVS
jgi:plastocyanin